MALENSQNQLIRRLDLADRKRLNRHFQEHLLPFKQVLYEQDAAIDYVYFPESGVASVITDLDNGDGIETGTIGREGLVGVPAVLGVRHSTSRVLCQIPGRAMRIHVALIDQERERGGTWFGLLLRYVHFMSTMSAQSAACNRMHAVDARMSRWLLMTRDRVDEDTFPLTQEFLAQMLGVARPTVNIAGATLQRAGFITYTRGRITVLNREGLESAACECYGRIRDEYATVLGDDARVRGGRTRSASGSTPGTAADEPRRRPRR